MLTCLKCNVACESALDNLDHEICPVCHDTKSISLELMQRRVKDIEELIILKEREMVAILTDDRSYRH